MKNKKTRRFKIRYIVFGLLGVMALAALVFMRFGGFGTGENVNPEEFLAYAEPVENITVPESAKIIALGEATHGNAEFQQLKLEVFKLMVKNNGVRAFALEGDYGGCEQVNRYIHGGEGTAQDAANGYYVIGTDFYKTHCNMPTRSPEKRTIQVFYSHDPLAKAAKLAGFDICWLDFTKVPENSELGRQASEYTYMGTLGESYSIIMRLLPPSYRMFQPPAELYDSMIFVTDVNPTKILEE